MTRVEELTSEMIALKAKLKEVRKEWEEATYMDRFAKQKEYVGRAFKECDNAPNYVRCFYVKGIDEKKAVLDVLEISYYLGQNEYYSIGYCSWFNPIEKLEEGTVVEIDLAEYVMHRDRVYELIKK